MRSQDGPSPYSAGRTAFVLVFLATLLRPHLSGIAYPFSQGVLLVPLLVGLGLLLLSPDPLPGTGRWCRRSLVAAWMLPAWMFLTLFWTADPGQGVRELAAFFLNVLVFTLAFTLLSSEGAMKTRWLVLAGLSAGTVALHAVYQRFFGFDRILGLLGRMEAAGENVTRFRGVIADKRVFAGFLNPNMLAGFLAILIPFVLDIAITSPRGRQRRVFAFLAAVLTCVLMLTASLGGILVSGIMALAVIVTRKRSSGRMILASAAIVAVLIAGVLVTRGSDFIIGPESSVTQRAGYMAAGIRMAAVHPFLGWGAGSTPGALMAFVTEGYRPVTDPHNFPIRVWIAWGVPGVLLVTFLLLNWAAAVFGRVRHHGWRNLPAGFTGLVFGSCAFILHSLIDMDFFVPETSFFGWWVMGAAMGLACGQKCDVREKAGSGLSWFRFLPGCLVLAAVLPNLVFFQGEMTAHRADRLSREGDYMGSAELYRSAGKMLPFNGRFALGEGRALLNAGHEARAVKRIETADGLMRASPYPSWEMGLIALHNGDGAESVQLLERALKRYPTSPWIGIDLARACLSLGDRARAVDLLRESRRHAVFDPEARRAAEEALEVLER